MLISPSSAADSNLEGSFLKPGLLRNEAKWPSYLFSVQPIRKNSINHPVLMTISLSPPVSQSRLGWNDFFCSMSMIIGSLGSAFPSGMPMNQLVQKWQGNRPLVRSGQTQLGAWGCWYKLGGHIELIKPNNEEEEEENWRGTMGWAIDLINLMAWCQETCHGAMILSHGPLCLLGLCACANVRVYLITCFIHRA